MSSESKFRKILARYVNHEITLHCSQFEIRKKESGDALLVLREPAVLKIAGQGRKGNWIIDHLWVKVPKESVDYFEKYIALARKIKVDGDIHHYRYKDSGNPQVGVRAKNIQILKYKKDIAKKYHLSPGQALPKKTMDQILNEYIQEDL